MKRKGPTSILPVFIFPVVWIAAILGAGYYNWTHRTRLDQQIVLKGQLQEWSELPAMHNEKLPRFRISGNSTDFRINPPVFRDLMKYKIPAEFAKGAHIEVSTEISSITHPFLVGYTQIIWVKGLSVNGKRIFTPSDIVIHEKQDG